MPETVELLLDSQVIERYPEILVGGFAVADLDSVASSIPEGIFKSVRPELERSGLSLQSLPDDPRIRDWRQAIGRCGLKPSTFKSSPEQLARRLLKGDDISTPFPVVNAYCAFSLRHLAAMGGYDADLLPEQWIQLRLANPATDHFQPLGGRPQDMPLGEDVVVYASGDTILCYAFNHRDSAETAIRQTTRSAVFFSEGASAQQHDGVRAALSEFKAYLADRGAFTGAVTFCNASSTRAWLELPQE